MNALQVARVSLQRFLRDRTSMFFVVVLPIMIIVVLGATIGGFDKFRVAVVDQDHTALSARIVGGLRSSPSIKVLVIGDVDTAARSVRRSEHVLAVVIPRGVDTDLRAGRPATIEVLGDPTSSTYAAAASAVSSAVWNQASDVQAARFATDRVGGSLDDNLARVPALRAASSSLRVETRAVDTVRRILPEGFDYSAPTMLVLFVFINALASGGVIIANRKLRMYERMLASPIRAGSIVVGETLCYLSIAVLQSLLIVVVGRVVFGVSWGDLLAAVALIAVWALVGTGAGVLAGTLFRTPEQASSIGPALGIAFGMLGGCMWPLEIVSPSMRTLGHVFPHAWAVDAWTILLSRNGGLDDIARQLGVLAAFAAGLLAVSTWRLSRRIV